MSGQKQGQKPVQKNGSEAEAGGNGNERRARIQAIKNRKAEKAAHPDTEVVYRRVPETARLLQIIDRGGDYAISKLRKGLALQYEPDKALPLIEEIAQATRQLSNAIAKVCKMVDVEYRPPAGLGKNGTPAKTK